LLFVTGSISGTIGSTSSSLIVRVAAHDAEAWRRLVWLYGPLVRSWIRRSRLQQADAEDVFQDVFRAVAQGIDRFKQGRPDGSFRGWLRTITRSKVIDHFRRAEKEPPAAGGTSANQRLQQLSTPPDGWDAPEDSEESENLRLVRLRGLELIRSEFEDRTWQMFWRVIVEGHKTREVAEDLGVSPDAVRVARWRVLRRLREELGDIET
jgi:RNA polymerase sigma-70 factor, ECF subfamily